MAQLDSFINKKQSEAEEICHSHYQVPPHCFFFFFFFETVRINQKKN